MARVGDFKAHIVRALEVEAGAHCASPSCRRPTSGPSAGRASGKSQVGVAAHIIAAQTGGPRDIPGWSPAQRSAESNGVWLCAVHAKAIDDDPARFDALLLRLWKKQARHASQARIDESQPLLQQRHVIRHQRILRLNHSPDEDVRQFVSNFLADTGVGVVWGTDIRDDLQMVLYELATNAAEHGHATELRLASRGHMISLRDDGAPFGRRQLESAEKPRGGAATVAAFERHHGDRFSLAHTSAKGRGGWSITDVTHPAARRPPCAIESTDLMQQGGVTEASNRTVDCEEVHVFFRERWSLSDGFRLVEPLDELARLGQKALVLHSVPGGRIAEDFLLTHLPHARIAR